MIYLYCTDRVIYHGAVLPVRCFLILKFPNVTKQFKAVHSTKTLKLSLMFEIQNVQFAMLASIF